MNEVTNMLKDKYPAQSLIYKDINVFYSNHLTFMKYTEKFVHINLHIPISDQNVFYNLYQSWTLSVPVHTSSFGKFNGKIKVQSLHKFITIQEYGENYMLCNDAQLKQWTKITPLMHVHNNLHIKVNRHVLVIICYLSTVVISTRYVK